MANVALSQYVIETLGDRTIEAIVPQYVIEAIHPSSAEVVLAQYVIEYINRSRPGSLTVLKVVVPSVSADAFDFTAGGGLDPATFSLQHGGAQLYLNVPVGSGYSIEETPNPAYTTTVEVSNGDDPANISIDEGEAVTVTFTNTQIAPEGPEGCPLGHPDAVTGRDGCASAADDF